MKYKIERPFTLRMLSANIMQKNSEGCHGGVNNQEKAVNCWAYKTSTNFSTESQDLSYQREKKFHDCNISDALRIATQNNP